MLDVAADGRTLRQILEDIDAYAEENNDFLLAQYVGELIAVTDVLVADYETMLGRLCEARETMDRMEEEFMEDQGMLSLYEMYYLDRLMAEGLPPFADNFEGDIAEFVREYYKNRMDLVEDTFYTDE